MVEFHQIEKWDDEGLKKRGPSVEVSFLTDRGGYYLGCYPKGIYEIDGEPPFHIFTDEEREEMWETIIAIYILTHGPDALDRPKYLNTLGT